MKSLSRFPGAIASLTLAMCALLPQAHAAPTMYVSPSFLDSGTGPISIGIWVRDYAPTAIGAVGFTLSWDSSLLNGLSSVIDPDNLMQTNDDAFNIATNTVVAGSFTANFVYDALDSVTFPDANALFVAEGSGAAFRLATVSLSVVGGGDPGTYSPLTLSGLTLGDFAFNSLGTVNAQNGQVCVTGNCRATVPEPTTPLLVMAALGALALVRKQQSV